MIARFIIFILAVKKFSLKAAQINGHAVVAVLYVSRNNKMLIQKSPSLMSKFSKSQYLKKYFGKKDKVLKKAQNKSTKLLWTHF